MNSIHVLSKILIAFLLLFVACQPSVQHEAQQFLDTYTAKYLELSYAYSLAEWNSNTRIVEGDETNANATKKARAEFSAFTGSKANIEAAQRFLEQKDRLTPLQVKQFKRILYLAADNPEVVKEIVEERIAAETKQTEALYGFEFKIGGKPVTTNRIDEILRTSDNLKERRAAWEASKNVGTVLKDGLDNLRRLRNATVEPLGYSSYFSYQVSDYGMTVEEMMGLMDKLNRELRPLYRELHTYARYELSKKYRQPVPDMLPADWLPNRWGQDWSAMVSVEGMNIDEALKEKSPEWIVKQAEEFYVSLGWPALPQTFWERSSLYPLPEGTAYKKNNHASAWHLDLQNDLRSLMSVEPNAEWYETTHHELGHVYYFMSYTNPDVPPLLREGANRAYHEAIGSMIGLAAMQKPFLEGRGIAPKEAKVDPVQALLKEALNYAVFIPFSTGTMSHFEHELYEKNLSKDQYNAKWWEIVKEYQGIEPPGPRGEQYCDAATKTHINDDAAQYYDYALSYVLLFQLHDHIATTILKRDPRATDYYGSKEVGEFLKKIMTPGASRDWRVVLKETTGEELNANAMLRYFEPLMQYLKEVNKGRKHTI